MPDRDRLLHKIRWTETEELRISENDFKGQKYLAVRVWFQGREGDTDKYFPGKQGINIPVERVNEFYLALTKGIAFLQGTLPMSVEKSPVRTPRKRGA